MYRIPEHGVALLYWIISMVSPKSVPSSMPPTLMENFARCYNRFIAGPFLESRDAVSVLKIGGRGSDWLPKTLFDDPKVRYAVADVAAGPGVDVTLNGASRLPEADGRYDIVVATCVLQHRELSRWAFREMVRVLKPDGMIILVAPSGETRHDYLADGYGFYADAFVDLANSADCRLEACVPDSGGPGRGFIGVLRRRTADHAENVPGRLPPEKLKLVVAAPAGPTSPPVRPASSEEERMAGSEPYLNTLARIHELLRPELYLEIGVRRGRSLRLSQCRSIGVDPRPELSAIPLEATLFQETSDDFFERTARNVVDKPIDLAFIDGLHLFEYALRDFMHVERLLSPFGLIVVDDIFPNHPLQGSRFRKTRVWTGDVWRLLLCLAKRRPDLVLLPLDTAPTGLLLIAGVDPSAKQLWEHYDPWVQSCLSDYQLPPAQIMDRSLAFQPESPLVEKLLKYLYLLRQQSAPPDRIRELRSPLTFGSH